MFCGLFRGKNQRKANKCKKLIEKLWCELKIEKGKRNFIVRQSFADVAQLLKDGQHDEASNRVEHLYKDMCIECAYHQVDQFSVQVYRNLHCISKNSELPTEVSKAISSLLFSSSMCEELGALRSIQKLFSNRYGDEFVKTNVGLLPGNLVDEEMKENFRMDSVPDDLKLRLMSALADKHMIEQRPWETRQTRKSSDCEASMSFSYDSQNNSDSTSAEEECVRNSSNHKDQYIAVQLENQEDISDWNGSPLFQETSNVCVDGTKELSTHKHELYNLNSLEGNVSFKSCVTRTSLSKRLDAENTAYDESEDEIERVEEKAEFRPRSRHVHPKLPDNEKSVIESAELKKESLKRNNSNGKHFEMMRNSESSDSQSDCDRSVSFPCDSEGGSDCESGSTSSYGLDFEDSSDSASGHSSASEVDSEDEERTSVETTYMADRNF